MDVDGRQHRLSPEDGWHPPLLEESPVHGHHRLVVPLDDAILLQGVQRGVVVLDPLVDAV